MSENLRLYTKAVDGMDAVVSQAGPGDWGKPSPCTGWTARHVIGHVIAVQASIEATARRQRPPLNPMENQDAHAGDDPAATWAAARAASLATLATPGILDEVVRTWRGEVTVDDMIGWNVGDTLIHTWDLARAIGANDRLDTELVAVATRIMTPYLDSVRGPNMFGPAYHVHDDADDQKRLLALCGRAG
ncbi:MAG TPA: TIGR03086 family metal-binding protein [Ilumatobacteraceae bacterium]